MLAIPGYIFVNRKYQYLEDKSNLSFSESAEWSGLFRVTENDEFLKVSN